MPQEDSVADVMTARRTTTASNRAGANRFGVRTAENVVLAVIAEFGSDDVACRRALKQTAEQLNAYARGEYRTVESAP